MKTTNRMNRVLAVVLALSMTFSTQGMSVLADELAQTSGSGTELVTETELETGEPQQTEAPAEKETVPQQTEAPAEKETAPQQTEAPAEKETAPQQTEAPAEKETAPQQTEVPAEKETDPQQAGTPAEKETDPQQAGTPEETKPEDDTPTEGQQGTEGEAEDESEPVGDENKDESETTEIGTEASEESESESDMGALTPAETEFESESETESESGTESILTILYRTADAAMCTVKAAGAETEPAADEGADETADAADAAEAESELVDLTAEELTIAGATAEAGEGYRFVSWTDETGAVVSEKATFIPEITDAMRELESVTFTANFAATPAGSMEAVSANGLIVKAEWDEGTFPEGVQMEAAPVEDQAVLDEAQALAEQHREETMSAEEAAAMITRKVVGVDISFYLVKEDGTREELEPADGREVRVTMELTDKAKAELEEEIGEISPEDSSLTIVHSPDDAQSEVVATTSAEVSADAVQAEFVSDAFSTYTMAIATEQSWDDLKNWLTGTNTGVLLGDGDPNIFTMLDDINVDGMGNGITVRTDSALILNLNGHTLTLNDAKLTLVSGANLTVNGKGGSTNQGSHLFTYHTDKDATTTITNCGNMTGAGGTAFELQGGATLALNDTVVNNNTNETVAFVDGNNANPSTVTISNSYFLKNSKELCFNNDTVTINSSFFDSNGVASTGEGGAARFEKGTVTINSSVFWGNQANNGGAIYYNGVDRSGTLTVQDSQFYQNRVSNEGGAIKCENAESFTLTSSKIQANTAAKAGGGICTWNTSSVIIKGGEITENHAGDGVGGGMRINGDTDPLSFEIKNAKISDNEASNKGGGICLEKQKATITDTTIKDNIAGDTGGGLYLNNASTVTVTNGEISGNESHATAWGWGGGGIQAEGDLAIDGTEIKGNYTYGSGGGLCTDRTLTIKNAEITDNVAWQHEGGGLTMHEGQGTISSTTITGNKTGWKKEGGSYTEDGGYGDWGGGGIFVSEGARLYLPGATKITQNVSGGFGGGLSGCSTGRIFTFEKEGHGLAVYGNRASGQYLSGAGSAKNADHIYAANSDVFMNHGYQDYFCAFSSVIAAKRYDAKNEQWNGSMDGMVVTTGTDGSIYVDDVKIEGDHLASSYVMGLTAGNTTDPGDGDVTITGNSSHTHGGGILCNGYIVIGKPTEEHVSMGTTLSLNGIKELKNQDGAKAGNVPPFTFVVEELATEDATDGKVLFKGTNDESGTIHFEKAFSYNDNTWNEDWGNSHTFWYMLYEEKGEDPSVIYDTTKYKFSVKVKREETEETITAGDANATVYVTKYSFDNSTEDALDAVKVRYSTDNGVTWNDAELDADRTTLNDSPDSRYYRFDTGDHQHSAQLYFGSWHKIETSVADNGEEKKDTIVVQGAAFVNTGDWDNTGSLSVSKIVKGTLADPNATYTVKVTNTDLDAAAWQTIFDYNKSRVSSLRLLTEGETATGLTFELMQGRLVRLWKLPAGEYNVEELIDGEVLYEASYYSTVDEKTDGTAIVQENKNTGVSITNTYPDAARISLEAEKKLIGAELGEGEFTFDLKFVGYQGEADQASITVGYGARKKVGKNELISVTNDAEGKIQFRNLLLKEAGIYAFELTEKQPTPADPTIEYDVTTYTVTVEVEKIETTGSYTIASVEVNADHDVQADFNRAGNTIKLSRKESEAAFINEQYGSLTITKKLDGNVPASGETYTIHVTKTGTGLTAAQGTAIVAANKDAVSSLKTFETEEKTFGLEFEIGGSKNGVSVTLNRLPTGTYQVEEVSESGAIYTAKYSVGSDSTNKVQVTENGTAQLTVTNVYPNGASMSLTGTKAMQDGALKKSYSFKLSGKQDGLSIAGAAADGTLTTDSSTADGSFKFDEITFTKPGTYTLTVEEVIPTKDDGIAYDPAKYTVNVTVAKSEETLNYEITAVTISSSATGSMTYGSDTEDGDTAIPANHVFALPQKTSGEGEEAVTASFINRVKRGSLAVTKNVTGVTANEYKDVEYKIRMTNESVTWDEYVKATATSAGEAGAGTPPTLVALTDVIKTADGKTVIGKEFAIKVGVTVTLSGLPVGSYIVEEIDPEGQTVLYKAAITGLTEGKVTVGDGTEATVTVTNTYPTPDTVSITLEGDKTLSGNRGKAVGEGEFSFVVEELTKAADGTESRKEVATGTTQAGGKIVFTPMSIIYSYEDVGEHTYEVSETVPEKKDPTITYDAEPRTVVVNVSFDKATGKLNAEILKDKTDELSFENSYSATGSLTLSAKKTLTGAALQAGQFHFELKDEKDTVLQTAANGADGSVSFDPLAYTQDDIGKTFTYTVSEKNEGAKGVTYDTTVYTVTVNVADSEASDGTLAITKTVKDAAGKEIKDETGMTFANTFAGSVTLAKVSANNKVPLSGAEFRLYKKDGTQYADQTYTTGADGRLSVKNLPEGEYYFVETKAPAGYVLDSAKQYPFEIQPGAEQAKVDVTIEATNVPEETKTETKLTVTKEIVFRDELWNAVDETFYVALFGDEALTNRLTDVKTIEFKNSNTSSAEFAKLDYGTYYVAETTADGMPINLIGGMIPSGEQFNVDFHDGNAATLTKEDGTKEIHFRNVFLEIPAGFYREGSLTVTKELLGADGQAKESNETFYAGIFSDAAHIELASNVSQNIVELALNGGSSAAAEVKVSVPQGGSTTVYVTEVDAQGRPVEDAASFAYEVTVDGGTVTMDEQNLAAEVVITNQEREEEESETEEITETKSETEKKVPAATTSVKTGDHTPIRLYVGLLLAAALLLLVTMLMRRRREN